MLATLFCLAAQHTLNEISCDVSREHRILDLMRSLERDSAFHLWAAPQRFERAHSAIAPDQSYPIPVYERVADARSDGRRFDAERARTVAAELFEIYGLPAAPLQMKSNVATVDLDCVALADTLAVELRVDSVDGITGARAEQLDALELAEMRACGWRVHVVDVEHFTAVAGDSFSPFSAFVAGIVEFLNRETDGDDVDLGALCFERRLSIAPLGDAPASAEFGRDGLEWNLESKGGAFTFGIDAARSPWIDEGRARLASASRAGWPGLSSAGAPAYLIWNPIYRAPIDREPRALRVHRFGLRALTVRQMALDGRELAVTSNSFAVLLPSTFDVLRPMTVEFDLEPGTFVFDAPLRIGFAATKP